MDTDDIVGRTARGSIASATGGRLPTFLLIGAMKTGTTSLYHYLRAHPQVFMPELKEVMFFDARHRWDRGLEWYADQFAPADPDAVALGEASTSYTKFPVVQGVPERIASVIPDVRLIYIVRDPIERMRSHYLYALSRGKESRPIERAFEEDPSYLDISRYAMQLGRYEPYFPREQLLLLESRDLKHRRAETLRSVFGFIGVDETFVPRVIDREFYRSDERRMPGAYAPALRRVPGLRALTRRAPERLRAFARRAGSERVDVGRGEISDALRQRLEDALRDDVRRLRPYMPPGFDGWGLLD
jgi:sulfotransferase family protein